MPERDRYIPGVPCWVDTNQPDPEAAVTFYSGLFGWEVEDVMPPGSEGHYFIARIRGGDVAGISPRRRRERRRPPGGTPTSGCRAPTRPRRRSRPRVAPSSWSRSTSWTRAARRCSATPRARCSASGSRSGTGARTIVNEAGSLNFNNLNTHDADAAKAFYGAVFGWGTMPMGGGAEGWTLPGYGDHLELLNPGTRERMASMGAPAGFVDVVATLTPLPDDDRDVPAHWSVTFATDDADATARKASELGGQVIAGPFDAPWVRMAVDRRPAGRDVHRQPVRPREQGPDRPGGRLGQRLVISRTRTRTAAGSGRAPTA